MVLGEFTFWRLLVWKPRSAQIVNVRFLLLSHNLEEIFYFNREPVKCDSIIRLHHLATSKNLHSHHFASPLSGNQEVSAYGDDQGMLWKIRYSGGFLNISSMPLLSLISTVLVQLSTNKSSGLM